MRANERPKFESWGCVPLGCSDPRSLGSWCIKGTDESTPVTDSSVPLMRHDLSDLGSLILIEIMPKGRTLDDKYHSKHPSSLAYAQLYSTRYFREKCQTVISNSQKRLEGFKRIKFGAVAASHCVAVTTPSSCLQSGRIKTLQIDQVFVHFADCNEYLYACITRGWSVFSMSKPYS